MGFKLFSGETQIDFIGHRKFFMSLSGILCALVLLGIAIFGFNWGVDFAGGSEIEVRFEAPVDVAQVRKVMESAGFDDVTVQELGASEQNSFLIRIGRISMLSMADADKAKAGLTEKFGAGALASFDFNPAYGDKFEVRFQKAEREIAAQDVRETIEKATGLTVQDIHAVVGGYSVIMDGISAKVEQALQAANKQDGMAKAELRRVEFVGPQVGEQLRNQGIMAVILASCAILVYIALRFETRFAPGAIVSMVHDIIIVLGYFLVTRREFNLTSVAVLLTIVGFSVNDTIVIYDRIRENAGKLKGMNLASLMNLSINQTLSRTLLTGVTTMVSVLGLMIFGIGQLFDFAMAMIIGIVVGTYSSIYIASPTTLFLEDLRHDKAPPSASSGEGQLDDKALAAARKAM
ncbi:MAG: protein translocase subunit SecF [Myxococcales bacterium]|jgi:preprotein translocase subunit SecF|nr:protein translocase subunit SecF [Myxococcales bacterium]